MDQDMERIPQDNIRLNIMRPAEIPWPEEQDLDAAIEAAVPEVCEFYRRLLVERGFKYVTVEWEDEGKGPVPPEPEDN